MSDEVPNCPVCGHQMAIEWDGKSGTFDVWCDQEPSVCGVTVSASAPTRLQAIRAASQRPPFAITNEQALQVVMSLLGLVPHGDINELDSQHKVVDITERAKAEIERTLNMPNETDPA